MFISTDPNTLLTLPAFRKRRWVRDEFLRSYIPAAGKSCFLLFSGTHGSPSRITSWWQTALRVMAMLWVLLKSKKSRKLLGKGQCDSVFFFLFFPFFTEVVVFSLDSYLKLLYLTLKGTFYADFQYHNSPIDYGCFAWFTVWNKPNKPCFSNT